MLKTVSSTINAIGALNYQGTWNASTNTPTLTSSVGTKGDYYVVSVAGSTNLDGETLWGVGDWAVFNGSIWQKVDGGDTGNFTTVTTNTVTSPASTALTLQSAGTTAVTVDTSQRVGIGTSSPLVKLVVSNGGADGLEVNPGPTTSLTTYNRSTLAYSALRFTANILTIQTGASPATTFTFASTGAFGVGGANYGTSGQVLTSAGNAPPTWTTGNVTIGNTTVTLGSTVTSLGNVTLAGANISATSAATATFATSSLPLVPAGYIPILLNGTTVKIPYYAV